MAQTKVSTPERHGSEETANDRFKNSYTDWFYGGVIAAVALHFSFFQFFPNLQAEDMANTADEMEAVELPPQVEIPPPPEQIARPATPKVAEANVDEDVTIAPTTFEENPVEKLPPPPKAGSPSDRPSFIPRDVDPRAVNDGEIQSLLKRLYPPMLRDAGIGGTVTLWLFVNDEGQVEKMQVQKSSGYDAFDKAAVKVAKQMEFKPAINRDKPIGVWVSRRITFNVSQ
jgi:protein TonB